MKSERRRSKSERRPKSEIRAGLASASYGHKFTGIRSDFGVRTSFGFRCSDFGFEVGLPGRPFAFYKHHGSAALYAPASSLSALRLTEPRSAGLCGRVSI